MTDFKVNQYLTIRNFKHKNKYAKFFKHGGLEMYQRFTGEIGSDNVRGWRCLKDDNIYKLEHIINKNKDNE